MNTSNLNTENPCGGEKLNPYRRGPFYVGMWACNLQRVSFFIVFTGLHLCFTYKPNLSSCFC